jgi:hypothetical protein
VRSERGDVTLVGLLVAMTLMLLVMGAAIEVFGQFNTITRKTELQNDAQDRARTAVDRLTVELRNLASPTAESPQAVQYAGATDLVFQTVDKTAPAASTLNPSNIKRVRYCVSPGGTLYRGVQGPWTTTAPPAVPTALGGACPGAWTSTAVATNVISGTRPLFTYNSTDVTAITRIGVGLALRTDPRQGRGDTEVTSGIFLRNQNRFPVATFSVVKTATGVVLNGAGSSDPDGDNLTYEWSDNGAAIGSGVTYTYGPLVSGSNHVFALKVTDGGGLTTTYTYPTNPYKWIP